MITALDQVNGNAPLCEISHLAGQLNSSGPRTNDGEDHAGVLAASGAAAQLFQVLPQHADILKRMEKESVFLHAANPKVVGLGSGG